MQKLKTLNISTIEFLRSSIVIDNILTNFLTVKDTKDELINFIKSNHPTAFDLHLEDSYAFLKDELEKDFFEVIKYISKRFYDDKNGELIYKIDKIEELQVFSSSIDMTVVECDYMLEKIDESSCMYNKERLLDNFILHDKKINTQFLQQKKEISDQHIHLGGSYNFIWRLHEIIKDPYKQKEKKIPAELYNYLAFQKYSPKEYMIFLHLLEPLMILYIEEPEKDDKNSRRGYTQIEQLFEDFQNKTIFLRDDYTDLYNIRIKNNLFIGLEIDSFSGILLNKAKNHFEEGEINKGDSFLVLYFLYNAKLDKSIFPIVQLYFTIRNIFKSAMTQQHRRNGFGYFSSFSSNNDLRRNKEDFEKTHVLDFLSIENKKVNIEGRVTPKDTDRKCANEIASYMRSYHKLNYKKKDFNLRILFHFIKEKEKEIIRWDFIVPKNNEVRKKVYKQSKAITRLLKNPIYRNYTIKQELFSNTKDKKIDLIKHLGGIDAASAEYNTPPEVFAPTFNYFKNCMVTSGKVLNGMLPHIEVDTLTTPNFKYTFHVGEDFRDILSGLRAIFEAVIFLGLKDGDRLGHALALGISPKLYKKHEIRLPKGELLDNAIFVYYMLTKFGSFRRELYYFRDIINELSKEIYGNNNDKSYSIDDMIDAWFLRRNCPFALTKMGDIMRKQTLETNIYFDMKKTLNEDGSIIIESEKYFEFSAPDFFNQSINHNCSFEKRYESIRYSEKAYDLFYRYHFDEDVRRISKEYYQHSITLFEDMYEYLQDIMMENLVSKRELYIEVQPTSNVLIGNISNLDEHPLTRFRPVKNKIKPNKFGVRDTKLKVIINTDNPSIQNTNILLEYYQLFNLLKEQYGHERAEKYLLHIVEEGNILYGN